MRGWEWTLSLCVCGGGGGAKSCLLKIGDPLRQTPLKVVNHSTMLGTLIPYTTFFLQLVPGNLSNLHTKSVWQLL